MIVDDDGLVENMIEKQLREAGYEEHSFDDPGSALSYFATERDRVALVALPVMMPGLTGDGMVREMRQH